LSLPTARPARDLLITLTFGVVLFTLVVQGFTTRTLLVRPHLTNEDDGKSTVQFEMGRLHALDAAIREVGALQRAGALADAIAEPLRQCYADRREQIHETLGTNYESYPELREHQTREAVRYLLQVKRKAVRDLAAKGQISAKTLDTLIKEIDGESAGLEQMADQSTRSSSPLVLYSESR
jgi:CPA1 family monovalent cation:H+ antiporter